MEERGVLKEVKKFFLSVLQNNSMTYQEWNKKFSDQDMIEFMDNNSGIFWLKLKSITRKENLVKFIEESEIEIKATKVKEMAKEIYCLYSKNIVQYNTLINTFLEKETKQELIDITEKFDTIKSELYKMEIFEWGGDQNNSLDKKIIDIIKKEFNYDEIDRQLNSNIALDVRRYTYNSWYNNWSTILIEHIFKSHNKVTAAIGKIKSVDFFIQDLPVDLKVTYFPVGFMKDQYKELYGIHEHSEYKKLAKTHTVEYDKYEKSEQKICYQIKQQLKDRNDENIDRELVKIEEHKQSIINTAIANPITLMKWLYEEQGDIRFGSENRIFVIVIDKNDLLESWQLKRNFDLLKPKIQEYLESFTKESFIEKKIEFTFNEKIYNTYADVIFIIK